MKALEKRRIERMDTEVTFLGFGALEIGRNWGMGTDTERPDEETAKNVLNTVIDLGINLVDSASAYHKSEERIGRYISDRREKYILATKCGEHSDEPGTYYDFSYKGISESIDRSLKLLNTDVIDLLQIHFGPEPEKTLDEGETLRAMKDAQKAGKVKYIGASIDGELAKRCILSGDFDVMQMGYNIIHRGNADNVKLARERGIGVLVRSGLGNGLLTSRVVDNMERLGEAERVKVQRLLSLVDCNTDKLTALALNFLYADKGVSSVIVGTKKVQNLKKNMELLELDISEDLIKEAISITE